MQIQPLNKDWLSSSWERSQEAGLIQRRLPEAIRLPTYELKERQWRATTMIDAVERFVLPLFNQMCAHTDSRLILTDADGVILSSWGQPHFREQLLQIALDSGCCWQEKLKGTNAIGTALIESRPISVIGEQHYIRQHQFISCSASPILDYQGLIVGILDITSEQQKHDITLQVLVQNMVQLIENHLISSLPNGATRIDLALDPSLINSGWQGIVIADPQGKVMAHNHIAMHLLEQTSLLGMDLQQVIESVPHRLIYESHTINREEPKARHKTTATSTHLHFGDQQVEKAWQQATKLVNHDIPILLMGETGVGKGEFVKALHQYCGAKQPLISVNCAALASELIESELFGYAPGAFTGANTKGYAGKIRAAHNGMLFLDEIGDMPLEAQSRLLQVLQDKVVVPVGCTKEYPVNLQIIAATHQPLEQAVQAGTFREDLYYRLNGLVLTLPALRERNDRSELVTALHHKYRKHHQTLCPLLLDKLNRYAWPGNLRELDNVIKVACLLASEETELKLEHLPMHIIRLLTPTTAQSGEPAPVETLRHALDHRLVETFQANQGNVSQTARLLGISRNTLYRKLRAIGLLT